MERFWVTGSATELESLAEEEGMALEQRGCQKEREGVGNSRYLMLVWIRDFYKETRVFH